MWLLLAACGLPPTPCVPDVEAAFAALPAAPTVTRIADGGLFPGDERWRYTFTEENHLGVDNHFQGLARAGRWLLVSGGDVNGPRSDLFVADLDAGRLVGTIALDSGVEWHAGGLAWRDGVLAVPTEDLRDTSGARTASVRLFDAARPLHTRSLGVVPRDPPVVHAAGLARDDAGWLLVAWDDAALRFFRAPSPSAFPAEPFATVLADDVPSEVDDAGDPGVHGQAVSLVSQCDAGLYAVMTQDTSVFPVDGGTDYADLYRVDVQADAASLVKVASRAFDCAGQVCNFAAAGGAYVDEDGALRLASVPHYRDPVSGELSLAEFGP